MARRILVTGGASGIGRAVVRLAASRGMTVIIADRAAASAEREAAELRAQGAEVDVLPLDVTDPEAVAAGLREVAGRHGRLDALVNCAGIFVGGRITEVSASDWDRIWRINVLGVAEMVRHSLPLLQRGEEPAIVNIASVAGQVGAPRMVAYCTTKGAVLAMTRALAIDLAPLKIRVNGVCPGGTLTAMADQIAVNSGSGVEETIRIRYPMGRYAEPEEIARVILFLSSPEASFVTGAAYAVDGGLTAI